MYDLNSYKDPFWAKSGNFTRGRDPLGIQNSSISIYARLLPGMTNLTLRLRYYGYYLWLLDEYHNLPRDNKFKKNAVGQYTFIRRAELILAFFMKIKFPDEKSVIGSDYVDRSTESFYAEKFHDIERGADKVHASSENRVYWDYSSGALGQYYIGSLIALELVENIGEGYFQRTEKKGLALANIYNAGISEKQKELLLKRIGEGKLYLEDIELLNEFALNKIIDSSEEWGFYLNLMKENDGKVNQNARGEFSFQRRESLFLFLNNIKNGMPNEDWSTFPKLVYRNFHSKEAQNFLEAEFGWFYYYLNELAHFFLETIFWGLLSMMEQKTYILSQFSTQITGQTIQILESDLGLNPNKPIKQQYKKLQSIPLEELDVVDEIQSILKSNNHIKGIAFGILGFIKLYLKNQNILEEARHYAINHFLYDKNGNVLMLFDKYIVANNMLSVSDMVTKIIKTLLNDHVSIAYNKMGGGEKNLLKFIMEDNLLIHIETMTPNFTNPRIRTLHNFLIDLQLINVEGVLTNNGEELLNELSVA